MNKRFSELLKVLQASGKAKFIALCSVAVVTGGGAVAYYNYQANTNNEPLKYEVSEKSDTTVAENTEKEKEEIDSKLDVTKKEEKIDSKDIATVDNKDSKNTSDNTSSNNDSNNTSNTKHSNNVSDNTSNVKHSNNTSSNKDSNNTSNAKHSNNTSSNKDSNNTSNAKHSNNTSSNKDSNNTSNAKHSNNTSNKNNSKEENNKNNDNIDKKSQPKPQPKPEPKPEIPNGYNASMTNLVNSNILNRYHGAKEGYFDSLLTKLGKGQMSKGQVQSILNGYEWQEDGGNHLGKVVKTVVQVYDVKGNNEEAIASRIEGGNQQYWKGVVYAHDGMNRVAILGIVYEDIIFE